MRDLVITLIVLGSLPPTLAMPHIGILMWSWLSFMNPHRLSWGFAFNFPFAQLVAVTTLMGWLISKEPKSIPWNRITMLMVALAVWINVTTLFTLVPEGTYFLWDRAMKMLLMTFVALALMRTRERINLLVWVIVLSIGFFGVKGGLFTLLTGGQYLVVGPPHSHISDNNTLAAALIMILPLMRYLQLTTEKWWVRLGLWGAMGLSICAALGSYSRGAFLTLGVLTAVMVLRSRRRFVLTLGLALLLAGGMTFMPEKWEERIETTKQYSVDPSVQGRFNAWQFAINLANARPIVGGGFGAFDKSLFAQYAPNPTDVHSAHSIFFEMIGEHGYVGLAIFILLLATSMYDAGGIRRRVRNSPDLMWAGDLGTMVQASLIAYTVAGTFLNIAFFDLPYDLFALTALLKYRASEAASDSADSKAKRRLRGAIALRQETVPSTSPVSRRAHLGGAKRSAE